MLALARDRRARRRRCARFCALASSSPTVVTVCVTPGSARISCAMRSAISAVASALVPSGARTLTSNCAWSSTGRKPLGHVLHRAGRTSRATARTRRTTTQRWRITSASIAM